MMNRPVAGTGHPAFFNASLEPPQATVFAPSGATESLAGRELPGDIVGQVSSLTMGQLFYILGHIQKLSAQAPVTAHALLAENLRICNALLHAECLAGMIEEPRLPMTAEELRRAKALSRAMQEDIQNAEVPAAEAAYGKAPPRPFSKAGSAARPSPLGPPGMRPGMPVMHTMPTMTGMPTMHGMPTMPTMPTMPMHPQAPTATIGGVGGVAGGESEDQKANLMQKLVHLTPDQIGKLPEQTKVQLLQFLQQNSGRG